MWGGFFKILLMLMMSLIIVEFSRWQALNNSHLGPRIKLQRHAWTHSSLGGLATIPTIISSGWLARKTVGGVTIRVRCCPPSAQASSTVSILRLCRVGPESPVSTPRHTRSHTLTTASGGLTTPQEAVTPGTDGWPQFSPTHL